MSEETAVAPESGVKVQKDIEQALTLREGGVSYRAIGEKLGCSAQWAHTLVMRGLDEMHDRIAETAARMRAIENRRLDKMTMRLEARQDNNSPGVTLALLKIQERRAKLNGLDIEKDEVQVPGSGLTASAESRDTLRGKLTAIRTRTDALGVTTTESLQVETSMPLPALGSAVAELTKEDIDHAAFERYHGNGQANGNGSNGDHA